MRRSLLFEAALVLLMIASLAAMYIAVSGSRGAGGDGGWSVSGIIAAPAMSSFIPTYSGNMFAGDNGMLYTVDGRHVNAISSNGSLLWSLEIPGKYRLPSYGSASGSQTRDNGLVKKTYKEEVTDDVITVSDQPWSSDSAVVLDGNLYILLRHEDPVTLNGVLMSIAPDGSLLWSLPFASGRTGKYDYQYGLGNPIGVVLHDNVLYVYSDYGGGVSRIGLNGTIIGYVDNVRGKPAIGDNGTLYVRNEDYAGGPGTPGYVAPLLEAYAANGTLLWRHSFADFGINESLMPMLYDQPYLRNESLYVWSSDGLAALDVNGSLKFRYHLPEGSLVGCGFDHNDTLYLSYCADPQFPYSQNRDGLVIMRTDGTVIKWLYADDRRYGIGGIHELPGGVLYGISRVMSFSDNGTHESGLYKYYLSAGWPIPEYYTTYHDGLVSVYLKNNSGIWDFPRNLGNLDTYDVTARDMATGELLWCYRLPLVPHSAVLDRDNAGALTFNGEGITDDNAVPEYEWYAHYGIPLFATGIRSDSWAGLTMANGTMFVYMWSYNYEYPPIYRKARCVYSGGLYTFGINGTLLGSIPTDSRIVAVQEVNGTIYYGTGGGKISAVQAGEIAGVLTVAASAIYLFLKFFPLGTVARPRARREQNMNRERVLGCVKDNPGVTLLDIAQALEMNAGTVRYHLMILGLSHRVNAFRADEKFVRFFVNSGTYGQGDQLVISLMRREPLRKIIDLLREQPGLSNLEMSRALDVHESSTLRNVKLLIEKGVVTRSLLPDGKITYSLSNEYIANIAAQFGHHT